jgi:hypothetical protein
MGRAFLLGIREMPKKLERILGFVILAIGDATDPAVQFVCATEILRSA